MSMIPHVFRRGAIYYWRRRLPCDGRCRMGCVSVSLRTADTRLARMKAISLTARSLADFEQVRRGMLSREQINAVIRIKARQVDEELTAQLVHDQINGGLPSEGMMGLAWDQHATVMAETNRRRASALADKSPTAGEIEILKARGWTPQMLHVLEGVLGLRGYFGSTAHRKEHLQDLAREIGLTDNEPEEVLRHIDMAALRGSAAAYDKFAKAFAINPDDDLTVAFPEGRPDGAVKSLSPDNESVASLPAKPSSAGTRPGGTKIQEIVEALVSDKTGEAEWDAKSASQARAIIKLFSGYLSEVHGIDELEGIRQKHLDQFDGILKVLNPRHGKAAEDKTLPVSRYLAKYTPPASKHDGKLSTKTRNRYWVFIGQLFARAKKRGIDTSGLNVSLFWVKAADVDARSEREKPATDRVRAFFSLPVFTGSAGADSRKVKGERAMYTAGPHVFHRAAYFAPMLAQYHGFRREEICGLVVGDVGDTNGQPTVVIRKNAQRRIKNAQSERIHALHPELIRLGFVEYVEKIRSLGYSLVFPDLVSPGSTLPLGDRLYDELRPGFKACGFTTHQLRHFFNNDLKQKGVSEEVRRDFMGHKGESESSYRYADAIYVEHQLEKLTLVENVTAHLQRQDIKLLAWVERRLVAPWARESRTGRSIPRRQDADVD